MAKKDKVKKDKPPSIKKQVQAALPQGLELEFPSDWRATLDGIRPRKESPTSIVNFLTCPLQWWAKRYSDLPKDEYDVRIAGVIGTFVHRVLEVFYSEPRHLRDEDLLIATHEAAWNVLKDGNDEDGIVSAELIGEFKHLESEEPNAKAADAMRGRFFNVSRNYVLAVLEFDGEPEDVRVVDNEKWVNMRRGQVVINGKIDRIRLNARGMEVLDDYKTGRAPKGEVDPLNLKFLPMALYVLMRMDMQKEDDLRTHEISSVQLLHLNTQERFTLKVDDEMLEKSEAMLAATIDMMDNVVVEGRIVASPSESQSKGHCHWCPLVQVCPAWNDNTTLDDMREKLGI